MNEPTETVDTPAPATSGGGVGSILGIATVVCVACCIGPILGVLGAVVALGLVTSILIGVAGLVIAVAAIAAFVAIRRRSNSCWTASSTSASVELSRRGP